MNEPTPQLPSRNNERYYNHHKRSTTKHNDIKDTAGKSCRGRKFWLWRSLAKCEQSVHESISVRTQFASHEFGNENRNDTYSRLSTDFKR